MKLADSWVEDAPTATALECFHDEVEEVDEVDEAEDGCGGVVWQPYVLKKPQTSSKMLYELARERHADRHAVRVRDAYVYSPKRDRSGDCRPDKDDDEEVYLRYTRDDSKPTGGPSGNGNHNSSAERIHPRPSRVRKDLKSDCIQSGMRRFIGRSRARPAVAQEIGITTSTTVLG